MSDTPSFSDVIQALPDFDLIRLHSVNLIVWRTRNYSDVRHKEVPALSYLCGGLPSLKISHGDLNDAFKSEILRRFISLPPIHSITVTDAKEESNT